MCSIHLCIPEARLLTNTHVSCLSPHSLQDPEAQRCHQWAQGQVELVKPALISWLDACPVLESWF